MTTSKKLWLGFGTLTALLVLSSVAILVRVRSIEGRVSEMANGARTRSDAARQLEINLLGYSLTVRAHFQNAGSDAREDAVRKAANVEQHLQDYQQVATTDRQREMVARFVPQWQRLKELGAALLDTERRQLTPEDSQRFYDLRTGLESLLDDEMQVDANDTYNALRDAALHDVQRITGFALTLLLIGAVIAVVTSAAVGRGIVKSERERWANQERLRITLASIGDAVIATDAKGHVTYLNGVAESLAGWKNDDATGLPLEQVFHIVNEESRQTVENPATRALREGIIVGLANHTVLISKDGTERPVDDSAAPIRDEQGNIAGCVLIFRDVTASRQAENALRRSEAELLRQSNQLTAFLETAAICMHRVGPDGTILWANDAELKTLGYSREEYIGHHIAEFHADLDVIADILARLHAGERLVDYEAKMKCKDGSIRTVLIDSSVLWEEGRFVHTQCFTRDITERKQAEEVAAHVAAIVSTSDDAIVSKNLQGIIQSWNEGAQRLFGYTAEEAIGRPASMLIPPDRENEEPLILERIGRGESIDHYETVRRRKDGSLLDISLTISPIKDGRGRVIGAAKIARDITERRQAEKALRENERRFREMIDAIPAAIYTTDAQGRITHFNPAAVEFSGRMPELGKDQWCVSWKLFHLDGTPLPHDKCPMAIALQEGREVRGEQIIAERPDGTRRWLQPYPTPLRDVDGRIVGGINMLVDVTERKQLEDELRQYAADLSESDRRKNEFLAILAHELRNPLAPIRNALQIMRLTDGKGQTVSSASEMMERQVGQMVRLVDDLLDVSRISRGKIELRKGKIELGSTVSDAVEAARSLVQCMEHELIVTLPPESIYLNADPARLAQVVGNLLNNACKFTDKGGHISLTVEREGDQAVIRVRDSGIGIAADKLSGIFEMFMQVDTSLERSEGGLGIGLTLVKNLVEMHGGTVEVQSAGVGQGSEFVVRLPIMVEAPKPLPPEPTSNGLPPTTVRRILVVDDNRDSAKTLAMLLKLTGNETQTAYDGLEAVEAAAKFKPDVVLLDIGLPKLNGYETCRRIRGQPWGKDVTLVALTGWGQDEDRQKSNDAGFNSHMVKPVDFATLQKLLAEAQPNASK